MSLLPVARSILESRKLGGSGVYFPQKEEWLLEWVVQRLREDDDAGAPEYETPLLPILSLHITYLISFNARARCNPEFWEFILHLLPASTSAATILKKHNILQLISKTFYEAQLLHPAPVGANLGGDTVMGGEEVYSTQEIISSPSSSSARLGSSVLQATSPRLLELLTSVRMVLLYIQQNWTAGSREGNVATVLRGTPEIGAQILGSYLEASQMLVESGLELEENWTSTVVSIWRSCVWGNPNSKKVHGRDICLVAVKRGTYCPNY